MSLKRLPKRFELQRWQRTLYIMFIAQVITGIGFSSIFPFLPLYVKDLGSTTGLSTEFLAGMVFSGQAITMMIASPIWGGLADRYGRKLMVLRAAFGAAVLLLLMAFVRSAEELVLLRTIQGLITGTVAATNALVAASAPRERSGYAMGLIQMGLGTGVAIGPLVGGTMADMYGYSAAFYMTSALLCIAGMLVWFGVEEDFIPAEVLGDSDHSFLTEWRHILSTPGIGAIYGMRFMAGLGRMMIVPIAPLFIGILMLNSTRVNTFTGLVVSVSSGTATLSAVYLGRLGDRTGHRRILIASSIVIALLYLPQGLVNAGWQLLVLQALSGVALGGIFTAIGALLANFTEPGEEGAVYGLDNSISAGARAIAPLVGSGVALWLGLRATFAATALIFFTSALLAIWLLPQSKPKRQAQVLR